MPTFLLGLRGTAVLFPLILVHAIITWRRWCSFSVFNHPRKIHFSGRIVCQYNDSTTSVIFSLHYKFILDRSQFSSQILVICGMFWFSAFIWRKLRLKLIEYSQILTARLILMEEHVVSGFNVSRAVILMSRIGMAVKKSKFSKIPNWRYYLLKTHAKRKKNWQNYWEWLNKPFRNASKPREWFWSKEIGFRTSWNREILNGVYLLMNRCFKDGIARGFHNALWPATKNAFTTIIPSAENHGERQSTSTARPNIHVAKVMLCITKLSSSMTMLGHMSQDRSRNTWKRWNGKSYPTRRTL